MTNMMIPPLSPPMPVGEVFHDWSYLQTLSTIRYSGVESPDRTKTGTLRTFAQHMRFDLAHAFPLLTSKKLFFKGIVAELLWFLSGSTDVGVLQAQNVHIWDEWALEDNTIGYGYGELWRAWRGPNGPIDQIANLLDAIRTTPHSRRLIVSAWDVGGVDEAALPPCHCFWQVVIIGNKLNIQLHQRSGDWFVGVPFNIASYALLVHVLCALTGYEPGVLAITVADAHLYLNHLEQAETQLRTWRDLRPSPKLELAPFERLEDLTLEHFKIIGYNPHPSIKAPVAV